MKTSLGLTLLAVAASIPARAEDVAIPARQLSARSTNVAAEYGQFGNLTLCVGRNGFMQWTAEVEGGSYYVHFFYCSGENRPCRLSVGGRQLPGEVLGETTGGFMPQHLGRQTYGPFELEKGKNTIRISTDGYMPHLKGLVVSTEKTPPSQDAFRDLQAEARTRMQRLDLQQLRAAVAYLMGKYGDQYPEGKAFLARVDALEKLVAEKAEQPQAVVEIVEAAEQLRHEALVKANPLLDFDKLLFVRRYTYQSTHYYTDYIDGCEHFGGNLCVLSPADGKVTELAPELEGGIFGRFDLSFDGRRVIFGYKRALGQGFRIWEVGVDGKGLHQLTFDPPDEQQRIEKYRHRDMAQWAGRPLVYTHHTDDMHPCYLPDGGICFVSTRCERGILCDGPDVFTTTTLYRMDGDGRRMEVLSDSPVSEASPSVMNDGRVLYTRWEYVDKADVVIKCLWAMRPDGTGSVEIFGNDITFPDTMLHGRAIPGYNNLFVVIGAPHMPAGVGTVIRLDINYPIRTREPMTYITPDVDVRTEFGWFHNRDGRWVGDTDGPLYTDAMPLSDKFFLVSCNPDKPVKEVDAYGLYLLDEWGNRVPIHRDGQMSCWQPTPLRPRPKPPVVPPVRPGESQPATLVMSDVYRGLGDVPRGTIKYLRVLETVPRPWAARKYWDGDSAYQQHAVVSLNGSLHVKRLWGIVPVEEDGSAHFEVPADKNLFLQALDENFMEVQRMRTFINLRPGESRSCIGCHEMRQWAPANRLPLAARRPPRRLAPQPGETAPRPIHYVTDVQPILDRHCVRCHNAQKPEGELVLTGELTALFNRSYEELLRKDLVQVFHENQPKTGDASPIPAYSLGSHRSRLIEVIHEGHEGHEEKGYEGVELSREEFIRLVTWIDANSPYYGSYFGRRNLQYKEHPDFRPVPGLIETVAKP